VSPVKYELGFYIPEDDVLHSDRSENLKSYIQAYGVTATSAGLLPTFRRNILSRGSSKARKAYGYKNVISKF
jgi:hypothetical protein